MHSERPIWQSIAQHILRWTVVIALLVGARTSALAQQGSEELPARLVAGEVESKSAASSTSKPHASLSDAQSAADAGDFQRAASIYRELLAGKEDDFELRLQLARVLSWDRQFPESLAHYDRLIAARAQDLLPQLERARVLSWSRNFDRAVAEYTRLLEQTAGASASTVSSSMIRLERARVLGWSKHYDQALADLSRLLETVPKDEQVPVLIEQGRVLSWSGRYDGALGAFSAALAMDGDNYDALLGKAQTLSWAGRVTEAAPLLRSLLQRRPQDAGARVAMAGLAYRTGRTGTALSLVDTIPGDTDAEMLGRSIRRDLRPLMHLRFGYADDRELAESGFGSSLRAMRYTGGFEFSLRPDVRVEISSTVSRVDSSNPVLAKYGADAMGTSTLVRVAFAPTTWLRLRLGAGEGTTGAVAFDNLRTPRRREFLYELQPSITIDSWRFDFSARRSLADATPLALHDGVVESRESASAQYTWKRRLRLGAYYWHSDYEVHPANSLDSLGTAADGGNISLTPVLYRAEHVSVEAGARYEIFRFADSASRIADPVQGLGSAGFFAPRLLQRYAATGHLWWSPLPKFELDMHGDYGPQRLFGFATAPFPQQWARTGSIGGQATLALGRWRPFLALDWFGTATAAGADMLGLQGSQYRSAAVALGVSYRF